MCNRLRVLPIVLLAAMLAPAPFRAAMADEKKDAPKDIADQMGVINDGQKKLRRSARNKDFNEESIKLAGQMIEAAKASREMVPPMAEKIADKAKKEKFIEGYKQEMDILIVELQGLEKALIEKRHDDAVKSIDKLTELKKVGHETVSYTHLTLPTTERV